MDIKIPKSWKELNIENLNYAVRVSDLEAYCDRLRAELDTKLVEWMATEKYVEELKEKSYSRKRENAQLRAELDEAIRAIKSFATHEVYTPDGRTHIIHDDNAASAFLARMKGEKI